MSKFKLKNEFESDDYLKNTTVKKFDAESLDEVFFHITDFLRGSGYIFDGEVGIIKPEQVDGPGELIDQLEFVFSKK